MNGKELIAEWERRQEAGRYNSYSQSMTDMANMIDLAMKPKKPEPVPTSSFYEDIRDSYREEQARLRAAGFDAYNCDMVDEFPRWG